MVKSESTDLDSIFHALSDSTRRAILRKISKKEQTVSHIAKPFPMSLAAVSKHLSVLESARLIERRKQGSFHFVRLNALGLKTAEDWLSFYKHFWSERLDALQELLEERE